MTRDHAARRRVAEDHAAGAATFLLAFAALFGSEDAALWRLSGFTVKSFFISCGARRETWGDGARACARCGELTRLLWGGGTCSSSAALSDVGSIFQMVSGSLWSGNFVQCTARI